MSWKGDESRRTAPGLMHSWRLWRYCCCRYGWYPLLVAPIITAGTIMSLYSTASCDFIRVDVGFTPSNIGWNQSTIELGMIHHYQDPQSVDAFVSTAKINDRYSKAFLVDGCRAYDSEFEAMFIDDDRTWTVARVMSYIAGISGMVATAMIWFFVVTPLPAFFFWPGVLLPALMVAFLAEGSKFLFFDTAICRNTIWYPSGADSLPQVAESCELGTSGYFAIAAGAVYFLCLIVVCLLAPERRALELNYGTDYDHSAGETDSANAMEQGMSVDGLSPTKMGTPKERRRSSGNQDGEDPSFENEGAYSDYKKRPGSARHGADDMELPYQARSRGSNNLQVDSGPQTGQEITIPNVQQLHHHHRSQFLSAPSSRGSVAAEQDLGAPPTASLSRSAETADSRNVSDDSIAARLKALDSTEDTSTKASSATPAVSTGASTVATSTPSQGNAKLEDDVLASKEAKKSLKTSDLESLHKKPSALTADDAKVSESRVNTIEKLEVNTGKSEADEMIEKFVADLNKSFNVDTDATMKSKGNSVGSDDMKARMKMGTVMESSSSKAMTPAKQSSEKEGGSNTYFQTLCTGVPPNASSF